MCFYPTGSYFLSPLSKKMLGIFSITAKTVSGQCSASTKDGNPITLDWILEYGLDPFSMDPVIQASMANILLSTPIKMAEVLTNQCLEKIIERYTLDAICREGFIKSVGFKSSRSAAVCLAAYGIVVEKVCINAIHYDQTRNWTPGGEQFSNRLGEGEMSRLANPQAGLMSRPEATRSEEETNTVQSNSNDTSKINYYDTMAKDISEHANIQGDIPTGKLVV
jgi:hypothetical protein